MEAKILCCSGLSATFCSYFLVTSLLVATFCSYFLVTSLLVRISHTDLAYPKCAWRVIVLGFCLAVAGCAMRPTGYVAAHGPPADYGYSDSAEGGDDYSILVKANSATSDERVAQLVLLRAAHLTLEKGGNRFIVIHSQSLTAPTERMAVLYNIPVSVGTDENKLAALVIHVLPPDATPAGSESIDAQRIVTELSAKLER
jgi:hypothetical protein